MAVGTLQLLSATPSAAQSSTELSSLSIEDLADIKVTSVSKRAEPLSGAPAAIYVIGSEDIRRSTATSLPEALRLAPNLQVQQIDARQFAIGARGFNGYETSNKLLGLIDGRSIYTSLHAGIFWELRQPVLEDIDRIEVVSGPGGTLWGPNAVNGVINVITKSALDTQGLLFRATASGREQTIVLRYGGKLGEDGGIRFYLNGADRDGLPIGIVNPSADGARDLNVGFRADWGNDADAVMVQGELFHQNLETVGTNGGHHLLTRWTHDFADDSSLQVQAYYDSSKRDVLFVKDSLENFDLSAQYDMPLGSHRFVWGAGARMTRDSFTNNLGGFQLVPRSRTLWLGNLFLQDTIALSSSLDLIAGLKAEQTSFTGIELLPNLRLAWRPQDGVLLWGAVSRSVRTPSRIDRNLTFLPFLEGGTFDSEKVIAIEAGYRGKPTDASTLSISLFYNIYDGLRTTEPHPTTLFPIRLGNGLEGHSYGIEAWGSYQLTNWWRLNAGVTTLHKSFKLKPGHVDLENGISLGNDPDFQMLLGSQLNLGPNITLDAQFRGVDSLPNPRTPGYVEADARLAWMLSEQLEFFVSGSNLLHKWRNESGDLERGQLVGRRVLAGTRVRFR